MKIIKGKRHNESGLRGKNFTRRKSLLQNKPELYGIILSNGERIYYTEK